MLLSPIQPVRRRNRGRRSLCGLLAAAALVAILPPGTAAAQATTAQRPAAQPQPPAPTNMQEGDVSCGADLSCFADLAADCTASVVSYTLAIDLAPLIGLQRGVESSTTDALRMQPDPDGSDACQFSIRVERVDNRFLPEAVQALKLRGLSQEGIDQTQQSVIASGKTAQGRGGTCLFSPDDLSTMLHHWQQGDFSTQDFAAGTCQGTYFSS